jgi:hypothetical protein
LDARLNNTDDFGMSDEEENSFSLKNSDLDLQDEEEKSIEPI